MVDDNGLAAQFGRLAGQLDNAMIIVTVADGAEKSGCLVGFSTQCSIDPPRYLVCISRRNHTHGPATSAAARGGVLAVHFLAEDQDVLARTFGELTGDVADKFVHIGWSSGPEGVPLLEDCPNRFVGRIGQSLAAGDHTIFLLDVEQVSESERFRPLGQQQVLDFEPGHEA